MVENLLLREFIFSGPIFTFFTELFLFYFSCDKRLRFTFSYFWGYQVPTLLLVIPSLRKLQTKTDIFGAVMQKTITATEIGYYDPE